MVNADVNKWVIKFYDVRQPNIDILNDILNYNWNLLKIDCDKQRVESISGGDRVAQ